MLRVVSHAVAKTEQISFDKINPARRVWVDAENPTVHELVKIAHKFKIPIAELQHPLDMNERQRLKVTNDYSLIIFATPIQKKETKKRHLNPFGVIVGKKFIITIHKEKVESLDAISLTECREKFGKGVEYFLFDMLSTITREFHTIIENIDDSVDDVEEGVLKDGGGNLIKQISFVRQSLLRLRKAVTGNKDVVAAMTKSQTFKERRLFDDLYIEFLQLADQVEVQRERIGSASDTYFTFTSHKINFAMKYFTVIASILLLPMLITSAYGMNISLPFQKHPAAFLFIIGIMIVAVALALVFFKREKWV